MIKKMGCLARGPVPNLAFWTAGPETIDPCQPGCAPRRRFQLPHSRAGNKDLGYCSLQGQADVQEAAALLGFGVCILVMRAWRVGIATPEHS